MALKTHHMHHLGGVWNTWPQDVAFRSSGCPGKFAEDISACDRPYGDSPPSDIASYPFQPKKKDLKTIRKQLGIPMKTV